MKRVVCINNEDATNDLVLNKEYDVIEETLNGYLLDILGCNVMYCKERFKSLEETGDIINRPNHYTQGKYETIDIIKDITGVGFEYVLVGNIIKYISRYKFKNGIEDLKKAKWYMDKLIEEKEIEQNE